MTVITTIVSDKFSHCMFRYAQVLVERCMGQMDDDNRSDASDDESPFSCSHHRKQLYENGVSIFLHSLLELTQEQFMLLGEWVPRLLSTLILCRSQQLRSTLQQVYEHHINPMIPIRR